jgi:oligopeptide/dipeptide ABC transporter ATP-binding protein
VSSQASPESAHDDRAAEKPLLDVRSLTIHLRVRDRVVKAADDVDLQVAAGECVGLVGESGSGKTMVARSVVGLLPTVRLEKRAGEIVLDGTNLLGLRPKELRKARQGRVSMIFQEPASYLNPTMRVGRQIAEALTQDVARGDQAETVRTLLAQAGLPRGQRVERRYPHQLSGGMKQRAMIALALASNPKLLIADEPTTALDVTVQAQVLQTLRHLHQERGMAILLITHDFGVIAEMCDRIYVMYAGQIVESADAVTLFTKPRHPYTRLLLDSLPGRRREGSGQMLTGSIPDLSMLGQGCRFAPRCPYAEESCKQDQPLRIRRNGDGVRCILEDTAEDAGQVRNTGLSVVEAGGHSS